MKLVLKLTALALLLLATISCIDLESDMTVDEEGSGTLSLRYSISKMVMELGRLDDEDTFAPLPVTEQDFQASAAMSPGLELISFDLDENEKEIIVEAEFEFTSVSDLSLFFSPDREDDPSLSTEAGENVFRYTLFTAAEDEVSEESMNFINSFFSEDSIILRIEGPSDINSVSRGGVIENGRTAEYSVGIPEIFSENEDIVWEVRW